MLPALVLLAVTLLFVFRDLSNVKISFVTLSGSVPFASALINPAALSGFLVLTRGSIRIIQLRRVIHRRVVPRPGPSKSDH